MNAFDIVPAACDEAGCKGCGICRSAEEVAQKSDYVITMLPNNDIVMDTYEKMVQNGVKPTTMFIDSSTIDPNVAKKVQMKHFVVVSLISLFTHHLNEIRLNAVARKITAVYL